MHFRTISSLMAATLLLAACGGQVTSDLIGSSSGSSGTSSGGGSSGTTSSSGGASSGTMSSSGASGCPTFPTCEVSYRAQIVPIFAAASCSSRGCHGDTSKPKPLMPQNDPTQTWTNLNRYVNPALGLPYVNSCSNDPKDSYILDNLDGKAGLPMPIGAPLTKDQRKLIERWVLCGAPNN
jgi:hypothetical protein